MSSRYSEDRRKVSSNFDQGFNNSMDELPDEVVWAILERMNGKADRISSALTCKRFYELDNEHRKSICLLWGWNTGSKELLLSLCKRFQNLRKIKIVEAMCNFKNGEYLNERGLYNLSIGCPLLADLTLRSCARITDSGLSHLASCSNLAALKLDCISGITGCGMSSVVVGCRKLASIHLIYCRKIVGLDWLGGVEKLEELCIMGCKAIKEDDLIKLGPSWQTLKRLQFKHDAGNAHMNVEQWQSIPPCGNMLELILVRSPCLSGGLSSILGKCRNLEKIHLDICLGIEDSDIIALAQNSTNLRTISLQVPSDFYISKFNQNQPWLTDESLKALALNCPRLESVQIEFSDNNHPTNNSFSVHGIIDLVRTCPIRELTLKGVHPFGDAMQDLRGAESLEMLELISCNGIRDVGIHIAAAVPLLRVLKLERCNRLTDNAFEPFRRRRKLEVLEVSGCRSLSEEGVKGAADSVSFSKHFPVKCGYFSFESST